MSNIHFTITNSIISKIEQIYRIWWVIENAHIVPERQQKLKQIARLRSWVYSTKIEWNRISYAEAERFLAGEKIKARPRDEKELKNYMKVLDYIESRESDHSITEKDIFKIHQLTTKDILDSSHHNKRRNQANAVYNEWWGIVFLPPDRKDVPKLIKELLNFVNQQKEISVIIRAWLLHHRFVIIHPFIDGNGRTARALTQLFLYQNGFNTKKYFSLEEYYDSDLANYYEAIFIWNDFYSAQKKTIDSTKFVEYFLAGLEHELEHLKKTIENIKDDEQFENKLIIARLNNRQIHISAYIKENLSVTAKELLTQYNVSIATIKRDLNVLEKNWIIKSVGFWKSTRYEPVLSWKWAEKKK
jgi:Fic family protein